MICQELRCKKQESKDHIGTLCKKHAEILEKYRKYRGSDYDPFEYKVINEKNCVWENGMENIRAIQIPMINIWIKDKESRKKTLQDMESIIREEIEEINGKLDKYEKMKNSRYVKN